MELIRGVYNIRPKHQGCVLTIGNFDGVHLGHQALLKHIKRESIRQKAPFIVMLFEPQPLEFFLQGNAPTRLTRFRDKFKYLSQLDVDYLLYIRFNSFFASMTAEKFISSLLIDKLAIRQIVVGDDFRFGQGRQGTIDLLSEYSQQGTFSLSQVQSFLLDHGERVSSTRIRQALASDDLALAERLLGRPYSISGRVIHGDELGRTIGFPTANIKLNKYNNPIKGVYAVEVLAFAGKRYYGVANIGIRPTVNKGNIPLLEIHLLDFKQNLYGTHLEVIIRKKLRNEQKFNSLDELKRQIQNDVNEVRLYFANEISV